MDNVPVVFISSTSEDLRPYRSAARDAALNAGCMPEMMEYWAGKDNPPLAECLARVDRVDVLVVVVAHRYGWVPDGQAGEEYKSITWLECERAVSHGKDVLVFLVEDTFGWDPELREEYQLAAAVAAGSLTPALTEQVQRNLARLREFKTWLSSDRIRKTFTTPDNLARQIEGALRQWKEGRSEFAHAEAPAAAVSNDPRQYLDWLRRQTAFIDIRGLLVGSGRAQRFPIDQLYIPLATRSVQERFGVARLGGTEKTDADDLPEDLGEAGRVELDQALQHQHLVILGDPGSGKSTFLRRIAFQLARAWLEGDFEPVHRQLRLPDVPVPLLLRAADLIDHIHASRERKKGPTTKHAPSWLAHALAACSAEAQLGLDESFFLDRLSQGSAIVLLDGVDEAPTTKDRKLLSKILDKATATYSGCRFVVTSRPTAYKEDVVLPGFVEVDIDALDDEATESFLSRWCAALIPEDPGGARQHHAELRQALHSRWEIRRLARNPVMLTALAVLQWNEKHLPEQRADLYESILMWLARSREHRSDRPAPERCIGLLQNLALTMHNHAEGRRVQVSRRWAAEQVAPALREYNAEERLTRAERFLEEEELDSGIVVARGNEIKFWHLTFQEYLAARALAARSGREQGQILLGTKKLDLPHWREVVLLLAGVLHRQGVERVDEMIAAILHRLGENPSLAEQARCVGLLGSIERDLSAVQYTVGDPVYGEARDAVMAIFDGQRSASVPIAEAIAAADALAPEHHPRCEEADEYWIPVAAGEFTMGAQSDDPEGDNFDKEAASSEAPPHKVHLDAFEIARYPVTVAEYHEFIQAGGYKNESYWQDGGFGKWETPERWDEQLQFPNRPAVYVSWYEAAAYAAWTRDAFNWEGVLLPTEAQWERAARGIEGRRYPWGKEDADTRRMNYATGKVDDFASWKPNVGHPTPVGVYPLGATPDGVCDLAGNVWEWCSDWHGEYSAAEAKNPTGPEKGKLRVLRGGAWHSHPILCRASYRAGLHPTHRDDDFGFRLVRVVFAARTHSENL